MTEYVIAVGLIGLAVVTPIKLFGWRLEESYFAGIVKVMQVEEQMDSGEVAPTR